MRSQVIVPEEWAVVKGCAEVQLLAGLARRVEIDLISQGASVFVYSPVGEDGEEQRLLVWCGQGTARVVVAVQDSAHVVIVQDDDAVTSVRVPELRSLDAAWRRNPSFTDLDPPKPFAVSPEVQAVMDRMNQNAIRREMLLLQALENRMKPAK